jgi:hypothetical protein
MFRRPAKALLSLASALLVCATLTGCGGPVTKANYDRISADMSEGEVEGILGKPSWESSSIEAIPGPLITVKVIKQCTWRTGDKAITVQFVNGKMIQKVAAGL